MGHVIAIRKTNARPEVVSGLEALLAKARCGELVGWFGIGELASGARQMTCSGVFADDLEYTAQVAASGLDDFCEQAGLKKRGGDVSPATESMPRRLRR